MKKPISIQLDLIVVNPRAQSRAKGSDPDVVAEYAADYQANIPLPPMVCFKDAQGRYHLGDFQRFEALVKIGRKHAYFEVRPGDARTAWRYSWTSNKPHGKKRTQADVRKIIEDILRDEEYGLKAPRPWSDRRIGNEVQCDHTTVAPIRRKVAGSTTFIEPNETPNVGALPCDARLAGNAGAQPVGTPLAASHPNPQSNDIRQTLQEVTEALHDVLSREPPATLKRKYESLVKTARDQLALPL